MQVETCQVEGTLRLGSKTWIVIHCRQEERSCLGATAPTGSPLLFDGAYVGPMSGTADFLTFLFSLRAVRRFVPGRYAVQVWLPGEPIPLAADCEDWLHFGISALPISAFPLASNRSECVRHLPASVATAHPPSQIARGGGRSLFGGA
jgi:hypothetical protein